MRARALPFQASPDDWLPTPHLARPRRVQIDRRPIVDRLFRRRQARHNDRWIGFKRCERRSILDKKSTYRGTAKHLEMRAATKRRAQVARQGADVGAFAANDIERE